MTTVKKDKEKVLDEVWTPDRVKSFLDLAPPAGVNPDFNVLYNAYKNMRHENFEQFLDFYKEADRDFNATNKADETLLVIMQKHKKSEYYIKAFKQYC